MTLPSPVQLFLQMVLQFTLLAFNFRVLAQGHLAKVIISDGLIAFFGFFLFQRLKAATRFSEQIGYTLGAMVGSAIGMWLSA